MKVAIFFVIFVSSWLRVFVAKVALFAESIPLRRSRCISRLCRVAVRTRAGLAPAEVVHDARNHPTRECRSHSHVLLRSAYRRTARDGDSANSREQNIKRRHCDLRGDPQALEASSGSGRSPYPMDEILTADGITEIIEHRRMERIFYISDDPEVRRKSGVP